MCGIIGYNGKGKTLNILIDGLKALEYRGYDSSGIAYKLNGKFNIVKSIGKINELEKKVNFDLNPNIGIGHTRWATHGKVSEANSHPHHVQKIILVHNGIIENYLEIKDFLKNEGYQFYSETDTEVACALIDYFYQKTNDIKKSLKEFINKVAGSYALGIMVEDSNNLYALRKSSPLIVAKNKDGFFIASDTVAITNYANEILYLDEEEIAEISNTDIKVFDKNLKKVKTKFSKIDKSINFVDKAGFNHYMLKEIHEEPKIVKELFDYYFEDGIDSLIKKMPDFTKYSKIDIVACGSAYHTGLVGKSLLEKYANIPVNVEIASEYRYKKNFYHENTLVIVVSQSGETADTLAALRMANKDGIDTLAIVNTENSSIDREAKMSILTKAGKEIAVATTKAYSAQVLIFILIALNISFKRKLISENEINKIIKDIKKMPVLIENTINKNDYKKVASSIYKRNDIFYIGRQVDYAIAMEGSLKLKEISYINSAAYAAGELKHGTISLVENGTPVIGVLTDKNIMEKTISNIEEVKSRGAFTVVISNENIENDFNYKIVVPKVHEFLEPLLIIIPLQLIAYEIASLRKCDIDKPKNLAKSVTVE